MKAGRRNSTFIHSIETCSLPPDASIESSHAFYRVTRGGKPRAVPVC